MKEGFEDLLATPRPTLSTAHPLGQRRGDSAWQFRAQSTRVLYSCHKRPVKVFLRPVVGQYGKGRPGRRALSVGHFPFARSRIRRGEKSLRRFIACNPAFSPYAVRVGLFDTTTTAKRIADCCPCGIQSFFALLKRHHQRPHLRFIHAWPPGVTRTILWHSAQRYLPLQFGFLQGVIRRRQTCQHLSRTFALRLATTSLPARQRSNSKHSRSVEFTKLRVHYVFAHAKTSDTKILPFAHVTLANRYYLPHSKLFLLLLALHRPPASAARALFLMQVQA